MTAFYRWVIPDRPFWRLDGYGDLSIRLVIRGIEEFGEALEITAASFRDLGAAYWWAMWGTNGWKRRTALVAWASDSPEKP